MFTKRITGRLPDGTAYVRSETGTEGVGYFTTQRRLPDLITKLARLEDMIERGELVKACPPPETCRERLIREHPEAVSGDMCMGCPTMYGYLPKGTLCVMTYNGASDCRACWDRPVEEVETNES